MPLDADYAESYLASNTAWDAEPELETHEQEALLATAKAIDVNGVAPGGTGYVETYIFDSLNTAVAQAWGMKKAKAVELHEGDETRIFDHCQAMEAYWLSRVSAVIVGGVISVSSGSQSVKTVPVW